MQTMPSKNEPVKHEVKQFKSFPVMMSIWTWSDTMQSIASNDEHVKDEARDAKQYKQ